MASNKDRFVVVKEFYDALEGNDLEARLKHVHEDAIMVKNKDDRTWADDDSTLRKVTGVEKRTREVIKRSEFNNGNIVVSYVKHNPNNSSKVVLYSLNVFLKENGEWKIIARMIRPSPSCVSVSV